MTTSRKKKLALILAAALIILLILLGILMMPSPTPLQTYTLTITHTTGGTIDPAPGNYTYPEGTVVTVNATAFTGYFFDYWNLDGSKVTSPPSMNVTMDANHTLHAVFALITHTLTISTTTGGITSPASGVHVYAHGTEVRVNATANIGYVFDHWELDSLDVGSAIPCVVIMNTDHVLQAVFKPLYMLTITCTTGGTTDPPPNTYQHKEGTVVEVTAIADLGYSFDHWELDTVDVGNDNPASVTMNADYTLHAVFTQVTYTLTISVTGEGTTNPAKGSHVYGSGSTATVSATPESGWRFDHWILDGENAGSMTTINVLMDSDHDLEAVFVQITYTLRITTTTGGTTSPPPGNHVYFPGTSVPVTAIPQKCYQFDHWELDGENVGSANPYTVTMNANHTLHAVFKEAPPVGGYAQPIDKSHFLAPKIDLTPGIGLAFVLLAAMAATIILIRRRNKRLKWEH